MRGENFIYRGYISRVADDGPYVMIPRLAPGMEFGPCQAPADLVLAEDDLVICAQVEDVLEDIVILAKVA